MAIRLPRGSAAAGNGVASPGEAARPPGLLPGSGGCQGDEWRSLRLEFSLTLSFISASYLNPRENENI